MGNLDIYEKYAEVPQAAQKTIKGGRLNGMTDINPMWRIKSLTEQFGACGIGWYTEIVEQWIDEGADGVEAAFMVINLFVKDGDEWSKPIVGTGGSMFVAKERGGLYTSDEAYKMAYTDALSVCCKMLGFGANVYWAAGESKYAKPSDEDPLGSAVCIYCAKPLKGGEFNGKYYSAAEIAAASVKKYGHILHPECAKEYQEFRGGGSE